MFFPRFCSLMSGDIAEGNSHKLSRISRIPSIVQEPPVSQVISSNIISSGICWGKKVQILVSRCTHHLNTGGPIQRYSPASSLRSLYYCINHKHHVPIFYIIELFGIFSYIETGFTILNHVLGFSKQSCSINILIMPMFQVLSATENVKALSIELDKWAYTLSTVIGIMLLLQT